MSKSSPSRALIAAGLLLFLSPRLAPLPARAQSGADLGPVKAVLTLLARVPTGKALIARAVETWRMDSADELIDRFKWGAASKTDAVLIRHYDPKAGKETRERRITIYVRQGQSEENLILDIAHELVHATSQPQWDPYDPELTAGKYIYAAIEGPGGEVDAVRTECQVNAELSRLPDFKAGRGAVDRCHSYTGDGAPARIRRDFYKVGTYLAGLRGKLGAELNFFPLLSGDSPALFSSTAGAPYPIALWEEFRQITLAACQNSRKRVVSSSSTGTGSVNRRPAEVSASTSGAERDTMIFLSRRCPGTLEANQAPDVAL